MSECLDFTAHRLVAAPASEPGARLSPRAALAVWAAASGLGWGLIALLVSAFI